MAYPSLEQYNEVLQHPNLALIDPMLKRGTIVSSGLGLPVAMCGGFALTYTVSVDAKKFAVRCFHKESQNLEKRYDAISKRLKTMNGGYFLDFEFQRHGVRVKGQDYPIVKMAWASGETLATFVETNLRNRTALNNLTTSLTTLSNFLSRENIAHGDIQPENVMVAKSGAAVQLIDYDGMYVDELKSLGSAEFGQRNFQHPSRTMTTWNSLLDRFAFISLNLSLRILQLEPDRWDRTQSDQSAFLFRAGDYKSPQQSALFQNLFQSSTFGRDSKNFAAICAAGIEKVPTLNDFIVGRNIPTFDIRVVAPLTPPPPPVYVSAYTVVYASDYAKCATQVGNQVELIGRVVEVRQASTRGGKPYIFINFGFWKDDIVKLNIWSEGLVKFRGNEPSHDLVGKWVSVIGLMEPPYVNRRFGYSHLSITLLNPNQMHIISESEASFRLSTVKGGSTAGFTEGGNQSVLQQIRGRQSTQQSGRAPAQIPVSQNQAILNQMKGRPQSGISGSHPYPSSPASGRAPATPSSRCFIATAAYGSADHPDVLLLRHFRDVYLSGTQLGRAVISVYERVGPKLAERVYRHRFLGTMSRKTFEVLSRGLRGILPDIEDSR
jgi:hypothetical protein